MTHPFDDLDYGTILALREGNRAHEHALVAHYTKGRERAVHLEHALRHADEVTAAAARLRAEMERLTATPPRTADAMHEGDAA